MVAKPMYHSDGEKMQNRATKEPALMKFEIISRVDERSRRFCIKVLTLKTLKTRLIKKFRKMQPKRSFTSGISSFGIWMMNSRW